MLGYKLKEALFAPIEYEENVYFIDHLRTLTESCNQNYYYLIGSLDTCSCPITPFVCPFAGYECKDITLEMWRDMYEKVTV